MKQASLFSGIGGFDLAAEWMGWENVFHCEINPFCRRILKYYWPYAESYEDITKTDFTIWRGRIDILTGGFPCQPYSLAGKQKGTDDDRHLWPEMLRAIREIKPQFIVGENVPGLVSWSNGLVFEQIHADLELEGYEVQAYILPACGVNAPHRRNRIWFVAYSNSNDAGRCEHEEAGPQKRKSKNEQKKRQWIWTNIERISSKRPASNSKSFNKFRHRICEKRKIRRSDRTITSNTNRFRFRGKINWAGKSRFFDKKGSIDDWRNFPTESPVCFGDDGISHRLDGITFSKFRQESLKGGGNAVVPQVVLQIYEAIKEYIGTQKR